MKYGVHPLEPIETAFVYAFDNQKDAEEQALELSQTFNVNVQVYKVIGTFRRETKWEPQP